MEEGEESKEEKKCEECGGKNICADCGGCKDCDKCTCKAVEESGGAEGGD
ncbi:hypothetical protein ACFL96_20615 [Thermoproteota archaeon]